MPAKSKKQQRLMGIIHAYQKGQLKNASPAIKKLSKNINPVDAEHFASTKHKRLPERVKKNKNKKINEVLTFEQFLKENFNWSN